MNCGNTCRKFFELPIVIRNILCYNVLINDNTTKATKRHRYRLALMMTAEAR